MTYMKYTDPLGSYQSIIDSLYDFTPAKRNQSQPSILGPESLTGQKDVQDESSILVGGGGGYGGGTDAGWGAVATPGPEALGLQGTISPAQALGIGLSGMLGMPGLGMIGAIAPHINSNLSFLSPMNMFQQNQTPFGFLNSIDMGIANALGVDIAGIDAAGGGGGIGGAGFGGAGPGAMGGGFGDPDGASGIGGDDGGGIGGMV